MNRGTVITSISKRLYITIENGTLSLLAEENASILVETTQQLSINAIFITLRDANQQIVFPLPFSGKRASERIRLDTFFSLVFNANESIQFLSPEELRMEDSRPRVDMRIRIDTNIKIAFDNSRRSLLHTASLLVEKSCIPVSRELLIYGSAFFHSLFNGNCHEGRSGVYEIKDVNVECFRWFIRSYLSHEWNFIDVDGALTALIFADRFEFHYLHTRIFVYLMTKKLKSDRLIDTLLLCGRFDDNEKIIHWIFKHCDTERAGFQLLRDCVDNLSQSSMKFALTGLEKTVMRTKMKGEIEAKCIAFEDTIRDRDLGIVLILHNTDGDIVDVKSFQISELTSDGAFGIHEIWEMLPEEYNLVKIPDAGMEFRREDENSQECVKYGRVMQVLAYITQEEFSPDEMELSSESEQDHSESPLQSIPFLQSLLLGKLLQLSQQTNNTN